MDTHRFDSIAASLAESANYKGTNRANTLFLLLRDAIITEVFEPGFVFPPETELCTLLGVGRSTLREAYSRLSSMNLIVRKKSGTSVNKSSAIFAVSRFENIADQADPLEVLEIRRLIEGETARLAAEEATPEDISYLNGAVSALKENVDSIDVCTVYDMRFHLKLAKICKNSLYSALIRNLRSNFEYTIYDSYQKDPTVIFRAIFAYERIVSAISQKHGDEAADVMKQYIDYLIEIAHT